MKIRNVQQNTPAWLQARLGIPTTSEFHKVLTPTGKLSSQSCGYMHWLLAEWMLGVPLESDQTQWMERGGALEDQAVASYEFERDIVTERVGFVTTDDGMIGSSPDRLAGDGLLEIKCPLAHTHVGYMLTRAIDEKYKPQVQGQLWVCEREWVDLQSYYPGLPTIIIRVNRDERYIAELSAALSSFVEVMLKSREEITQKYGPPAQPKVQAESVDGLEALGITNEDVAAIMADEFAKRK